MERKFEMEKNLLESYDELLRLKSPLNKIVNGYLEVQNLKERLDFTVKNKIDREKHKLISLNEILQARSPINILRKGYAIIEDENGDGYDNRYTQTSFADDGSKRGADKEEEQAG